MLQCSDVEADRKLGAYWEQQFCLMASTYGFTFTPLQMGRDKAAVAFKLAASKWHSLTLPDVVIWSYPGQHHEIKHKNPNRHNSYGLEVYRFRALLSFAQETKQDVMYTIHDHDVAGGRTVTENNIAHWRTANVEELDEQWAGIWPGQSWVDGKEQRVKICYWPTELWIPLQTYWERLAA